MWCVVCVTILGDDIVRRIPSSKGINFMCNYKFFLCHKGCAAILNHGESGRQLIDLGVKKPFL